MCTGINCAIKDLLHVPTIQWKRYYVFQMYTQRDIMCIKITIKESNSYEYQLYNQWFITGINYTMKEILRVSTLQ